MRSILLPNLILIMCLPLVSAQAQESTTPPKPLRFEGYPGAPEINVVPRKDKLIFYPCIMCHAAMEPNPEIRQLNTPHDSEVKHGRGRIWCLSCHDLNDRNHLRTLLGEPVDFNDAYLVCGGCHANRQKDWTFGVHGKRVANWQGPRTQYNCTHCHDPHDPVIKPRAPSAAPHVRAGLQRVQGVPHDDKPRWRTQQEQEQAGQ